MTPAPLRRISRRLLARMALVVLAAVAAAFWWDEGVADLVIGLGAAWAGEER